MTRLDSLWLLIAAEIPNDIPSIVALSDAIEERADAATTTRDANAARGRLADLYRAIRHRLADLDLDLVDAAAGAVRALSPDARARLDDDATTSVQLPAHAARRLIDAHDAHRAGYDAAFGTDR